VAQTAQLDLAIPSSTSTQCLYIKYPYCTYEKSN